MMITAAGVHDEGDDAIQIYVERRWLLHEEGHRGAGKLVLARSMPRPCPSTVTPNHQAKV